MFHGQSLWDNYKDKPGWDHAVCGEDIMSHSVYLHNEECC